MRNTEVLSTQAYELYTYEIDKIFEDGVVTIVLRNLNKSPYGVCSFFKYRDVGSAIDSELLSWHNVFFCSNYYGVHPHQEYMSDAVQQGKKTTATIPVSNEIYNQMVSSIPENCCVVPYFKTISEITMAYVYRKGTLSDYFDFDEVKKVYMLHGICDIEWDTVSELFSKFLEYFADEKNCGFSIQAGSSKRENLIILGLLLGYPIESTVAFIRGDYRVFGNGIITSDMYRHFAKSSVPYVDQFNVEWYSDGKTIYCDGQQESLYGFL